jgi:hypothetical protein
MRYYVYGKYESYEDVEKKLIQSDYEMRWYNNIKYDKIKYNKICITKFNL